MEGNQMNLGSRLFRPILLVLTTAVLISGCAAGTSGQPETQEPVTLTVMNPPQLSNAALYMADAEGYFADQGLKVEFSELESTVDALPAIIQGDIDVATGSISASILNAIAQGADVKLVADKGYVDPEGCAYIGIVANNDVAAAGGFDNPDGIKGSTFVYSRGSISEYLADYVLPVYDLDLDHFERISVPRPAIPEAIGSGEAAFASTGEPWITLIEQAGQGTLIASPADYIPNFQYAYVWFGPTLLKDNPDAGRRFMVAYLRAVRQFSQGKTERNLELVSETTGLDQELLEAACWPTFRDDISVNPASVLAYQEWAIEKGQMDVLVPEEQFYDPSFVEYALENVD
jgi:NitT/TauT family transport system substrate-binding protein